MRTFRWRICAVVLALGAGGSAVRAQVLPTGGRAPLLDVPWVPQSEDLCGAAAAAMAFRFWGGRDAGMAPFEAVLAADGSGIRTADLVRVIRAQGWTALPIEGGLETVDWHLARGRPLIALIGVGGGRFHYVTIVGRLGDEIVYHDPAVSPYQRQSAGSFLEAWDASGRWSLLILPGGPAPGVAASPIAMPTATSLLPSVGEPAASVADPCDERTDAAVRSARAGDSAGAREALVAAARACPDASRPVRELAALTLLDGAPADAAALATRAVTLDPRDAHAWEILAASRYLSADDAAALDAWNRVAPVTVSSVTLGSTSRTRQTAILGLAGVHTGERIDGDDLRRGRRRLDLLPAATSTRLDYRMRDGRVDATAAIAERPSVPGLRALLLDATAGVLSDRGVTVHAASVFGEGELWSVEARWLSPRQRYAVALALPAFGGVLSFDGRAEREAYGGPGPDRSEESRRRVGARYGTWLLPWLSGAATVGLDRWDRARYGSLGIEAGVRSPDDRATFDVRADGWAGSTSPFGRLAMEASWTSRIETRGWVLSTRAGGALASAAAPRMVWPGAGTGRGRAPLARAHPLLSDGYVTGDLFGRRLAWGGVETIRWHSVGPIALGGALFVDVATAGARLDPEPVTHADAGIGFRAGFPGGAVLRLDYARGEDGRSALSIAVARRN